MNHKERLQIAGRISIVSIVLNVVLSIIKIAAGILGNSSAMVADGVHSVSDVATTVMAYIGIKLSTKKADEDHQYGHEKLEPVMGKLLAIVLLLTGLMIGYSGIKKLQSGFIETPSGIALYAAVLSIFVKEWMYRYTIKGAKKIGSTSLKADAWHHRTDALSSVGSMIGVGGAMLGYTFLDPLASVGISIFIVKIAFDIYMESVKGLIDTAADKETVDRIMGLIENTEGVIKVDMIKTRIHGNRIYVDVEIAADAESTLREAHEVAEAVHDKIELEVAGVKHCMVHVNPAEKA